MFFIATMTMNLLPYVAFLVLALFSVTSFAFDDDVLDTTGCPAAFRQKCKCGKQRYVYWKPDQDLFVVNCTNTGFTGIHRGNSFIQNH